MPTGLDPSDSLRTAPWLTLFGVALLVTDARLAHSQNVIEIWPEVDVFWQPAEHQRTFLELSASTERESREREATVGLYQDYVRLPRWYARAGYRYTFSVGDEGYRESRAVTEGTVAGELTRRTRWFNRTRAEFRWVNDRYSYRLRERIQIQYRLIDNGPAWAPYATTEVYYDSRYRALERIGGRVGSEVRISRAVFLDVYLARQNNSRDAPPYVTALGITTRVTMR